MPILLLIPLLMIMMPVSADDLNGAKTVKELAVLLGYSYRHTQRLIASGEIEHLRIGAGRGRVLITPRQVADYLNRHNTKVLPAGRSTGKNRKPTTGAA